MLLKIGMLGDGFIGWGGGIDFLKGYLEPIIGRDDVDITLLLPYDDSFKENVKNILRPFKWTLEHLIYRHNLRFFKRPKPTDLDAVENNFHSTYPSLKIIRYFNSPESRLKAIQEIGADVIFPSFYDLGSDYPMPWIGYIADLQHKQFPEYFTEKENKSRDAAFTRILNSANSIIVNARSVKLDFERYYSPFTAKIHVSPFAPIMPETLYDLDNVDISRYSLPKRYFIISNQFWMHKDHKCAFSALAKLHKDSRYRDIHIVCTGNQNDYRSPSHFCNLLAQIEREDMKDYIHFLGYIPKIDQIKIMTSAIAVLQPTLFEGGPGGGATYNAVSMGKRVILSDIPVNKEIEDGIVTFFHASDSDDLCNKMKTVISTPAPNFTKEELLDRGRKNREKMTEFVMGMLHEAVE